MLLPFPSQSLALNPPTILLTSSTNSPRWPSASRQRVLFLRTALSQSSSVPLSPKGFNNAEMLSLASSRDPRSPSRLLCLLPVGQSKPLLPLQLRPRQSLRSRPEHLLPLLSLVLPALQVGRHRSSQNHRRRRERYAVSCRLAH